MTRIFRIVFVCEVEIEIDETAINQVDDEWRESLYNLVTPEDIAEHLAYNLVFNNAKDISYLDGWANLPKGLAKITEQDVWVDDSGEIGQ